MMVAEASTWLLGSGTLLMGLSALATWVSTSRGRQDTAAIRAEFAPNGGSSMRDAVTRLEAATTQLHDKVDTIDARLIGVEEFVTTPTGAVPVVKKATAARKAAPKKGTIL